MRLVSYYVLGILCLFCCSCSLKQNHALFQHRTPLPVATDTARSYIYRIKQDDILQIRNIQDFKFLAGASPGSSAITSAGQSYKVDEDGNVLLPGIGPVSVGGLTKTQAQNKIQDIYVKQLLAKEAIIELTVLNLKVTVLGEISSQGNYPLLREKTSLIEIIGQAGGLTKNADEKTIKIIRGKRQQEIPVDLSNISTIADPRIIMQDNDIVYIAQNKRAIRDDKLQNFSTVIQPSLLIFNTALFLLTLFK